MNAVNHRFEITGRQKWRIAIYSLAIAITFALLATYLRNTNIDSGTSNIIDLVTMGVVTGISLRLGTKQGWVHYTEIFQPGARYVFTKKLKIGVLWRVLVVWFAGRVVSILLLNQADSDLSLALLLFLSTALVVMTAMYVGLRFGWKSADSSFPSGSTAVAS